MNKNPQYKKSGAMFMVAGFGVVILAISAVTTFSFFATYFSQIFPEGMLGPELASLLAGGAGVILFDIAAVYWLYTFLNHAETSEQRGIALLMLIVTFVGAAGASVAQLGLAASGDVALDPATRQSIANASVWTVIIGVVSNFGANIAYGRFSLASKQAVMEADRRDMVQNAEDEQMQHIDSLIAQKVKTLLSAEADSLALLQAQRITAQVKAREMAKYAGVNGNQQPTPPQRPSNDGQPKPIFKSRTQRQANNSYYFLAADNGAKRWYGKLTEVKHYAQVEANTFGQNVEYFDRSGKKLGQMWAYQRDRHIDADQMDRAIEAKETKNGTGAGPYKPAPFE